MRFLTSCGLVCNCCCIALLLNLSGRQLLVGNDSRLESIASAWAGMFYYFFNSTSNANYTR